MKASISAFVSELVRYKHSLGYEKFYQFPNLLQEKKHNDDVLIYCHHLETLYNDFNNAFEDVLNIKTLDWGFRPILKVEWLELQLQEELLIELSTHEIKIEIQNQCQEFLLQKQVEI